MNVNENENSKSEAGNGAKPLILKGRVHLIIDSEGKLIDNIDTDMIFHNAHLAITERAQMGRFAFGNLEGYKDFPERVKPGDMVIAGANFGSGSSRQQAVDCFPSLGVTCVAAKSFGSIYFRNAINSGFPVVRIEELDLSRLSDMEEIAIDLVTGVINKVSTGVEIGRAKPFSEVQMAIYKAGGLFEYARKG